MKAIVICKTTTYGCQEHNGHISDWTSGGSEIYQEVDFTYDPTLSNRVNAIKHFKPLYQFGNSVTLPISFDVEIIPSL